MSDGRILSPRVRSFRVTQTRLENEKRRKEKQCHVSMAKEVIHELDNFDHRIGLEMCVPDSPSTKKTGSDPESTIRLASLALDATQGDSSFPKPLHRSQLQSPAQKKGGDEEVIDMDHVETILTLRHGLSGIQRAVGKKEGEKWRSIALDVSRPREISTDRSFLFSPRDDERGLSFSPPVPVPHLNLKNTWNRASSKHSSSPSISPHSVRAVDKFRKNDILSNSIKAFTFHDIRTLNESQKMPLTIDGERAAWLPTTCKTHSPLPFVSLHSERHLTPPPQQPLSDPSKRVRPRSSQIVAEHVLIDDHRTGNNSNNKKSPKPRPPFVSTLKPPPTFDLEDEETLRKTEQFYNRVRKLEAEDRLHEAFQRSTRVLNRRQSLLESQRRLSDSNFLHSIVRKEPHALRKLQELEESRQELERSESTLLLRRSPHGPYSSNDKTYEPGVETSRFANDDSSLVERLPHTPHIPHGSNMTPHRSARSYSLYSVLPESTGTHLLTVENTYRSAVEEAREERNREMSLARTVGRCPGEHHLLSVEHESEISSTREDLTDFDLRLEGLL